MRQAIQGCYDCVHRAFFVFVILHDEWFPLMLLLLKYILCSNKSKELGEFFWLVSEQGERILIQACWASMKFTGRGSLYSKYKSLTSIKSIKIEKLFQFWFLVRRHLKSFESPNNFLSAESPVCLPVTKIVMVFYSHGETNQVLTHQKKWQDSNQLNIFTTLFLSCVTTYDTT